MRFLSYDSKFGRFFLKLSYACCLNFMWFICCLPVFTIGAATTALYYTSFKIAKDEGSFITTMFFRSFRQNFKQATVIWMIMLVTGLYAIVLAHIFPLLSIASNTTANMFKNAFLIGTHYLFVTLLIFFVHYAMFFLVVNVFTPLIIFGEGLCAVICAHFLLKILRPMLQDPNQEKPNEAAEALSDQAGEESEL